MSDTDVDPGLDPSSFILREQRSSMAHAMSSLADDPEKATRAIELGNATGDNPTLIYPNLENYEEQHKAALTASLLTSNKYLRQYVDADPMHAKISNDGYASLDDVSQSLVKLALPKYKAQTAIAGGILGGIIRGYKEGAVEGGGVGDWALKSEYGIAHPLEASIAAVGWSPFEIALRFGQGAMRAATEGAKGGVKAAATAFGADEQTAERMYREAAVVIKAELMW